MCAQLSIDLAQDRPLYSVFAEGQAWKSCPKQPLHPKNARNQHGFIQDTQVPSLHTGLSKENNHDNGQLKDCVSCTVLLLRDKGDLFHKICL